jgi:acyl carrier protein
MTPAIFLRIQGIAADLFEIPHEQVTPLSSPENIENWDSVQHLNLILALEQEFGILFSTEEIDEMKNLGAIKSLLERKLDHSA